MQKQNNQLVLRKDDCEILISYLNNMHGRAAFDHQNAEELKNELKKAKLVNETDFPGDVVRLNSKVKIKAEKKDEMMELIIVRIRRTLKKKNFNYGTSWYRTDRLSSGPKSKMASTLWQKNLHHYGSK